MPVSRKRKPKYKKPFLPPPAKQQQPNHVKARIRQGDMQGEFYQGVIPSPEMMLQFRNVDPDLPNRILLLTENEGSHRRKQESRIITHALVTALVGNVCALLAVGAICFVGYLFMKNGYANQGGWIIGSASVSLAGIFIIKRWPRGNNSDPLKK